MHSDPQAKKIKPVDLNLTGEEAPPAAHNDNYAQILEEHRNKAIDKNTQEKINQPLKKEINTKHQGYLQMILELIANKEIDVFVPATILKQDFYQKLKEADRNKVDATLVNLANKLQRLNYLKEKNLLASFQTENLVESIWQTKEAVESVIGDVYKV